MLVGTVTVSMFSFITPSRVNAAADLGAVPIPLYITVGIGPYTRQYRNTMCEVGFFDENGECTNAYFLTDPERYRTLDVRTFYLRKDTRQIVVRVTCQDRRRTVVSAAAVDITYVPSIYQRPQKKWRF